jgi:hypothetical protein
LDLKDCTNFCQPAGMRKIINSTYISLNGVIEIRGPGRPVLHADGARPCWTSGSGCTRSSSVAAAPKISSTETAV